MEPVERVKVVSDIVVAWVGLLAVIVGGLFAVVQYVDNGKSARVKVTLEFFERYQRDAVLQARQRVHEAWAPATSRELNALLDAGRYDAADQWVNQVVETKQLRGALVTLVDFFDALQVCIAHALCDRSTAEAMFQSDASRIVMLHWAFIAAQRQEMDATFAQETERFVRTRRDTTADADVSPLSIAVGRPGRPGRPGLSPSA